MAYIVVGLWQW